MSIFTQKLSLLFILSALLSPPLFAEEILPFPAHLPIPPATVLSPEEMLKTLTVPEGFHVELVASEPLISTPVATAWDADGRLWVVEMNGYMRQLDGSGEDQPNGRVVILEDSNGDGRMDKSTVFLDHLVMPRAIALRQGGALIAVPPNVLWCPDANHDLIADRQEVIIPNYTGGGNPEHQPNGLLLAIDGWYYNAKSSWRYLIKPNGDVLREPTVFHGQWGITQDDFGRIYTSTSEQQILCDLLPSTALTRNSNHKEIEGLNVEITPSQRLFPTRVTPGVNRGYRKGILNENGRLQKFTGAAGPLIYRGDALPAEFLGNSFTCEPTAHLVKRNIHTEKNGMITAVDAYNAKDFLTSTSERFRPVNLSNGPDGALYITDMARGVVQHITYLTPWLRDQYVTRQLGQPLDQGRIWRVVPNGFIRPPAPRLSSHSPDQLVADLTNPNGWFRDTAQRLLAEQGGDLAVPALQALAASTSPLPSRIAALWSLHALGKITPETLAIALRDPQEKIRASALRIAEPFIKNHPPLATQILALTNDPSDDVRLQLLLTLGSPEAFEKAQAEPAILSTLLKTLANPLAPSAALAGLRGRELEFLNLFLSATTTPTPDQSVFLAQLAKCILQERQPLRLLSLLSLIENPKLPATTQLALLKPLTPPKKTFTPIKLPSKPPAIDTLQSSANPQIQAHATQLSTLFTWPNQPGAPAEIPPTPLTADDQSFIAKGATVFSSTCIACHLAQGQGQPGLAPPLAGSEWVSGPPSRLVRIALHGVGGPIVVAGKDYSLAMTGFAAALNDEQIAQVLSYVRHSFGAGQTLIQTSTVTKIRAASKDRGSEWTAEELERFE
jgi:mono/diheme cytochrome c family protein/glucose/arabinose dehydrogenase